MLADVTVEIAVLDQCWLCIMIVSGKCLDSEQTVSTAVNFDNHIFYRVAAPKSFRRSSRQIPHEESGPEREYSSAKILGKIIKSGKRRLALAPRHFFIALPGSSIW